MLARLAAVALLALAAPASAQSAKPPAAMGEPVTGTLKTVAADHVVLSTAKGDVEVLVTPETRVLANKAASASEIKPGGYVGTANLNTPAGGQATEVHLMDNGPNVHFAMDADKGLMMTNGHVKSVRTTAKGEEMDVDYGSGVRHVVVPAGAPVNRMAPSNVASLTVGRTVTARVRTAPDGKRTASYIVLDPPK